VSKESLSLLCSLGVITSGCVFLEDPPRSGLNDITPPNECGIRSIELVGEVSVEPNLIVGGARLGGISGIHFSPPTNDWLLISDDRGPNGGPTIFTAKLTLDSSEEISVIVEGALTLNSLEEELGMPYSVDAEAVRSSDAGSMIWWAFEGDENTPAGLRRLDLVDGIISNISLPSALQPQTDRDQGPRPNRSLEGLAIDPDEKWIWVGLEAPLLQDGNPPTAEKGAHVRIIAIDGSGKMQQSLRYRLEPIANHVPGRLSDNGLSEILALGRTRFLALERSGLQQSDGSFTFHQRIFCSFPTSVQTRLDKQLLADVNGFGDFARANFEGMTFGPDLPDGRRSLVLVEDNNFSDGISTTIAVFAINDDEAANQ
jgi:hypothetical protein